MLKELVSYSLYNVAGKLIFTKSRLETDSSYSFSTSDLSNGIYIVKLNSVDKTEMATKKLSSKTNNLKTIKFRVYVGAEVFMGTNSKI
ncbi:T9SS type A sorting domain-containing protein [Flavobacterium sp. LB2P74]|uniref:T9SS type A sorting domain-containing protein n=1 Tax=Flavobacterium sp. LB2P74 TaxID=3401717 RepID=UPI003AB0D148